MDFPILVTGELIQNSSVRSLPSFAIEHFYEGHSRQTQLRTSADRTLWRLTYRNLIGQEAMRLRKFFESLDAAESFSFTDPWTQVAHPNCRMAAPQLILNCDKDNRFTIEMEIENAD